MTKPNKYPANEGWIHVTIRYLQSLMSKGLNQVLEHFNLKPDQTEVARFTRYKKTIKITFRKKPDENQKTQD